MTAPTLHWAAGLIGKPWRSAACGPAAFGCWGLVRWVFRVRQGIELPAIAVGDDDAAQPDQVGAIKRAAQASGWRQDSAPAREDDIVLMRSKLGRRHVGVMVRANGRLGLLHADGHQTPAGPVGAVVWQPLAEAIAGGYHDIELWRRAP